MTKKTNYPQVGALGAQTIALALTFGSGQAIAAVKAEKCESTDVKVCAEAKSQEEIEHIQVHGIRNSIYRYDKSGDARRTEDLVDTPQIITVLTQDQIQESGKSDLKDILAAQSGVTLGTGENGNAFGDRYIIRGHEARSDVFVDGLRDPGMTTRESFATERVEITKGPSSTFAGRGSSGGAVNSVTKKASTSYNFGRVDLGIGTDDHHRATLDYNIAISDVAAFRFNLLDADETKPGRDGITQARQGAQASAVYEAQDNLSFILDGYYLKAEDVPDLGSYYDSTAGKPIEDVAVYAQDSDFLDSEVSTFTFRTNYQIADNLTVTNATRVGSTENGYVTSGTSATERADEDPVAPGAATMVISAHQGWQEVDYWATQFNVFWNTDVFGKENKFVWGLDLTSETVENGFYNLEYNNESNCKVNGRRGVSDGYCFIDGNGNQLSNISGITGRSYSVGGTDALFDIETTSLYFMDTVAVTDNTQVFFGLRQDSFDYSNDTSGRSGDVLYEFSDDMYNGHVGIVHSITEDGNVYFNYSTATNINGGESDLGANCGYGGICGTVDQAAEADPELVENIELGTKWMILDDNVMLSFSIFQITKSDVMESVGDSYSTLGTLNTGENRVKGFEFGLIGDITEKLSAQITAASMDSEVLESYNDEYVGLALSNFADESVYIQLRYQLTEDFAFGGDYSYQSEMYGGQPDTAAGYDSATGQYSIVVPDYQVINLFANYNLNEQMTLRLNIGNVLDEEYWTAAYRSGSFMYLGAGQSTRLTFNYQF